MSSSENIEALRAHVCETWLKTGLDAEAAAARADRDAQDFWTDLRKREPRYVAVVRHAAGMVAEDAEVVDLRVRSYASSVYGDRVDLLPATDDGAAWAAFGAAFASAWRALEPLQREAIDRGMAWGVWHAEPRVVEPMWSPTRVAPIDGLFGASGEGPARVDAVQASPKPVPQGVAISGCANPIPGATSVPGRPPVGDPSLHMNTIPKPPVSSVAVDAASPIPPIPASVVPAAMPIPRQAPGAGHADACRDRGVMYTRMLRDMLREKPLSVNEIPVTSAVDTQSSTLPPPLVAESAGTRSRVDPEAFLALTNYVGPDGHVLVAFTWAWMNAWNGVVPPADVDLTSDEVAGWSAGLTAKRARDSAQAAIAPSAERAARIETITDAGHADAYRDLTEHFGGADHLKQDEVNFITDWARGWHGSSPDTIGSGYGYTARRRYLAAHGNGSYEPLPFDYVDRAVAAASAEMPTKALHGDYLGGWCYGWFVRAPRVVNNAWALGWLAGRKARSSATSATVAEVPLSPEAEKLAAGIASAQSEPVVEKPAVTATDEPAVEHPLASEIAAFLLAKLESQVGRAFASDDRADELIVRRIWHAAETVAPDVLAGKEVPVSLPALAIGPEGELLHLNVAVSRERITAATQASSVPDVPVPPVTPAPESAPEPFSGFGIAALLLGGLAALGAFKTKPSPEAGEHAPNTIYTSVKEAALAALAVESMSEERLLDAVVDRGASPGKRTYARECLRNLVRTGVLQTFVEDQRGRWHESCADRHLADGVMVYSIPAPTVAPKP